MRLQSDCVTIAMRLRCDCDAITKRLRGDCKATSMRLQSDCDAIAKRLRCDCKVIIHRCNVATCLQSNYAAIFTRLQMRFQSDAPTASYGSRNVSLTAQTPTNTADCFFSSHQPQLLSQAWATRTTTSSATWACRSTRGWGSSGVLD
jgi:hypothetical protein